MKVLELTQEQADQIGTPFTCDACKNGVEKGDRWAAICLPYVPDETLKTMLLCDPCYEKLVPIFREFFHLPVPSAAEAEEKE